MTEAEIACLPCLSDVVISDILYEVLSKLTYNKEGGR